MEYRNFDLSARSKMIIAKWTLLGCAILTVICWDKELILNVIAIMIMITILSAAAAWPIIITAKDLTMFILRAIMSAALFFISSLFMIMAFDPAFQYMIATKHIVSIIICTALGFIYSLYASATYLKAKAFFQQTRKRDEMGEEKGEKKGEEKQAQG